MNLGRELLSLLIYEVEVDRVADLELLRRQVVLPLGRVIPGEGNLISVLFLNGEDLGGHVDVRNLSSWGRLSARAAALTRTNASTASDAQTFFIKKYLRECPPQEPGQKVRRAESAWADWDRGGTPTRSSPVHFGAGL